MHRPMDTNLVSNKNRGAVMEILIPLAFLGVWIILQVWVLPKFGVKT